MEPVPEGIARPEPTNHLEKLCRIPLAAVCENLTLADVVDISLATPRCKVGIHNAKLVIDRLEVAFDPNNSYVLAGIGRKSVKFGFTVPDGVVPNSYRQIGPYKYKCAKTPEGFFTNHYDMEHGIPAVLNFFVSIFDCSETSISLLSIDLSVIADLRSVFEIFKHFRKIEKLILKSGHREHIDLTLANNMHMILNNWDIRQAYIGVNPDAVGDSGLFSVRLAMNRFEKLLKLDHVHLEYAEWITSQDFLSLDVKTIIIEPAHRLTAADLNQFMKQWLESGNEKLMWLEVKSLVEFERETILDGLPTAVSTLADSTLRCPFHCNPEGEMIPVTFYPNTTRQITRTSDNVTVTATISITDYQFFFHVSNGGSIHRAPSAQEVQQVRNQAAIARMHQRREEMLRELEEQHEEAMQWADEIQFIEFVRRFAAPPPPPVPEIELE